MRIAVTYDKGQVFQHFGKTQEFKIYDIENGQVTSSEVIGTGTIGHEALAGLLAEKKVVAVICGGIGGGAQSALDAEGITIYPGVSGNVDEAVASFLRGELGTGTANCDHHHEEETHECCHGGSEGAESGEESCGGCGSEGGCGGCGGGCGGPREIIYPGRNAGKTVRVHYKGTFNDGSQFDSSYDRNEPLEFVCGVGMMIPGFDKTVVDMEAGQSCDIHLMPEEAYGQRDERNVLSMKIAELPGSEALEVGQRVALQDDMGRHFPVTVTFKDAENITLDANHEMAGKELNFHIELVEVEG